jgi:Sulfotransferase family
MSETKSNLVLSNLEESRCVFLITQGRSGSTLLLRLVNEIDGYNICGENKGALGELYKFYEAIVETEKKVLKNSEGQFMTYRDLLARTNKSKKHSGFEWYNVFKIELIERKLRELVLEMFNSNREYEVWGFKEVRYGTHTTYSQFQGELNFLKFLFPQAKFIFNTREIEEIVKSGWWSKNIDASRKILTKQQTFFNKYQSKYPDYTYAITYHDLINNTSTLQQMFDFLGADFDLEKYRAVLARR